MLDDLHESDTVNSGRGRRIHPFQHKNLTFVGIEQVTSYYVKLSHDRSAPNDSFGPR